MFIVGARFCFRIRFDRALLSLPPFAIFVELRKLSYGDYSKNVRKVCLYEKNFSQQRENIVLFENKNNRVDEKKFLN